MFDAGRVSCVVLSGVAVGALRRSADEEAFELTRIWSVAGLLGPLMIVERAQDDLDARHKLGRN